MWSYVSRNLILSKGSADELSVAEGRVAYNNVRLIFILVNLIQLTLEVELHVHVHTCIMTNQIASGLHTYIYINKKNVTICPVRKYD